MLQLPPWGPSNEDINGWLEYLSSILHFFTVSQRISDGHWQLDMSNSAASFTLDIFDQGAWLTYGTVLVHDVRGQGRVDFYGNLLDLNGYLNGAHIGRHEDQLILTREESKGSLNVTSLAESLLIINNAHQDIYPSVYELIDNLNLKPKNQNMQPF